MENALLCLVGVTALSKQECKICGTKRLIKKRYYFILLLFQVIIKDTMSRSTRAAIEMVYVLWHLLSLLFWYFA